jgi:hypothetical protein
MAGRIPSAESASTVETKAPSGRGRKLGPEANIDLGAKIG